jgi:two-component system NtrC family sensor kinase
LQQRIKELEKETSELKQMEVVLQKERNTAQQYLDIAGVTLVVLNADQTVSMINKNGREILGYGEDEIVGKNWFDTFVRGKDRQRTRPGFLI